MNASMITSKLTTKAQTTIPQPVRAALRLQAGDELIYEIVDERVILTKASRGGKTDDPFRTFSEWSSEADTKAYGKL
jgi:antitoxin PrlF